MGFNYLQTDDRDDYFASFGSDKVKKSEPLWNLILNGEILLDSVKMHKIQQLAKKKYTLTGKQVKYGLFKKYLVNDGYIIEKVKQENNANKDI